MALNTIFGVLRYASVFGMFFFLMFVILYGSDSLSLYLCCITHRTQTSCHCTTGLHNVFERNVLWCSETLVSKMKTYAPPPQKKCINWSWEVNKIWRCGPMSFMHLSILWCVFRNQHLTTTIEMKIDVWSWKVTIKHLAHRISYSYLNATHMAFVFLNVISFLVLEQRCFLLFCKVGSNIFNNGSITSTFLRNKDKWRAFSSAGYYHF